MWQQRFPSIEAAGAAVLCAVLTQHWSSRRTELPSELLCWLILPALFKGAGRGGLGNGITALLGKPETETKTSRWSMWFFAASIAISAYFKAEGGIVKLCPALTPLLLVAQKVLVSDPEASSPPNDRRLSPTITTAWVAALVAGFSTMSLLYWDLRESIPAIIPAAGVLALYATLLHGPRRRSFFPQVSLEEAIIPVSARAVASLAIALAVRAVAFSGVPEVDVASTAVLGLAKAISWYTLAKTVRYSSWCVATTIGSFAIASTRDPFVQSSEAQALAHIATSILALGQTIHFLPKQGRARSTLWVFALIFVVPYAANILAIRDAQASVVSKSHPVEDLIGNAKVDFDHLVKRQSQSYTEAHNEYLRRYGVEPPPGFRVWYEFAESRQSPIIDDFNILFESVSPFWELSGKEVREIMEEAQNAHGNELWVCTTTNTSCNHPYRTRDRNFPLLFERLLKDVRGALPDVKYLINHFDEPAVLIPRQPTNNGTKHRKKVKVKDLGRRHLWPEITKYCRPQTSDEGTTPPDTFGLSLPTNISSLKELCRHPEYRRTHGLLNRPDSVQLIESAVPVLSTGSFSTMGDVIFPSPAYIEDGFKYDPVHDVEWEEKRNNIYWAGSTTGGYAADGHWRFYQRQRFVEMGQNIGRRQYSYLREVGGVISRVKSSFLNTRLFDVSFTRINQCRKKYCREQGDYFRTKGWAHKDEALRSRLVFDIDGNGISGRYYKLLASKSTPLKMTIIREWHDERLVPWLHYVPVSPSMEELPELVAYLTSTEEGQERAREIAEAGRKWYFEALREDDLAVYVYRLLLELARLQDPEREAGKPGSMAGPSI